MIIHIKNMVCLRCKLAVQDILGKLNIEFQNVELGKVMITKALNPDQLERLDTELKIIGLELINDKKKILVERIKTLIRELFYSPNQIYLNLSVYLSNHLEYDYNYISNIFSEVEGNTIERFYIETRIERVKELIIYETLNVTQIAYRLNFSSASHLCQQFRKVTGITPSKFKKLSATEDFIWRKV